MRRFGNPHFVSSPFLKIYPSIVILSTLFFVNDKNVKIKQLDYPEYLQNSINQSINQSSTKIKDWNVNKIRINKKNKKNFFNLIGQISIFNIRITSYSNAFS